jgi:uncharacterized damage-inducible protein DinB
MQSLLAKEFMEQSVFRLNENTPRIAKCLNELIESEIWLRPNEASNSIGNLILHLCGNIRQYAISSLGGKPDTRKRDEEFAAKGGYNRLQLLEMLESTVVEAINTILESNEENLLKTRMVQGFHLSGTGIIIHVTEHFSYHTGQIAFMTKMLKGKDLGFYSGIDLNLENEC